jgi:uncharacterized membrane protein
MSAVSREDKDLVAHIGDSLHISLVPLPAALLGAALVSDGLYWFTAAAVCARTSEWLLGAGLAIGSMAAVDWLIRYVSVRGIRASRARRRHVAGTLLALLLSVANLVYRLSADPGGAVLPVGIALSLIVVCLLLWTAALGRRLAPRVLRGQANDGDLL